MQNDGWRGWGDYLLIIGLALLFGVALSLVKISLTTRQSGDQHYLKSQVALPVLLPPEIMRPSPASVAPAPAAAEPPAPAPLEPLPLETESPATAPLEPSPAEVQTASGAPMLYLPLIQQQESVLAGLTRGAFAGLSAGPVVRLVIPSLKIDRAVVAVGMTHDKDNRLTWNTDALFSTSNRADLVGQTVTSANPGEGGNIVLIGHNYNNGWYANEAVFVNLLSLEPGSQLILYTESGKEFDYTVQSVKKVPWQEQDSAELEKHHKYMWPTDHEQVTLVTCGGANLFSWSARIYAVALPSEKQAVQ